MLSLDLLFLLACLGASGLVICLGLPLRYGWVRPNPVYGFRTAQTLRDPQVWYLANRVSGFWLVLTGILIAGVSAGTYAVGVALPYCLFSTLVALIVGVIVMAVQSDAASRRPAGESAEVKLQFRLLTLFVVTTVVAIGCALLRLPGPWTFRFGLLWTYAICVVGLAIAKRKLQVPQGR
jgi:uncharacterized membrane protein